MLDNAGMPVEIIDGFIGSISVSVPWTALLSESCCMDIQGLEVTITPKQRVDTGTTEISVSPGDRRKSPASRLGRAGYSDPNNKKNKYFVLHPFATPTFPWVNTFQNK